MRSCRFEEETISCSDSYPKKATASAKISALRFFSTVSSTQTPCAEFPNTVYDAICQLADFVGAEPRTTVSPGASELACSAGCA